MPAFEDLTGKIFGRLTVIRRLPNAIDPSGQQKRVWLCRCECGRETEVRAGNLKSGNTKSCVCLDMEQKITHGLSESPTYTSWREMKRRCYGDDHEKWKWHEAKGIKVCDKWMSFEGFFEDMGSRPEGTTLDRIDSNGDYTKENCRWADLTIQSFNKNRQTNNKSGRTGVFESKDIPGTWLAYINKDRKRINLGSFKSFDEAVSARRSAELKYYGVIKDQSYGEIQ